MRKKILLVDDNKDFLDELADLLRRAGFSVDEYYKGGAALADIVDIKPDLAIIDLRLQDINGIALIDAIKKKVNLPIIALTAFYNEQECLQIKYCLGIDEVLTKDFSAAQLLKAINLIFKHIKEC